MRRSNVFMAPVFVRFPLILLILVIAGCSSTPGRVAAPDVDAESAASEAISLYDSGGDGKLDQGELVRCPGILARLDQYDRDGDQLVTEEEIATRLNELLRHGTGATQLACTVTYQGRPLSGATVVFEPEPYLGGEVKPASGQTNAQGTAQIGMSPEDAPASLGKLQAIHYGTFKVRITHPSIDLPAKYNTETSLGYETIAGDPFVKFAIPGS